jgi:hypothetical protein
MVRGIKAGTTILPRERIVEPIIIHRGIEARRGRTQHSTTMPRGSIMEQMIMDRGIKARTTMPRGRKIQTY